MPHYRIKETNQAPILVYEAPIDEKTKELRKQFDMDEETGYPRFYNWRRLAQLGRTYKPEDAFLKLGDRREEATYSTRVTIAAMTTFTGVVTQLISNTYAGRPWYSKPYAALATIIVGPVIMNWLYNRTLDRQAMKNGIYIDYMTKHPDRFEPIYRPKLREVLLIYNPVR